MAALSAADDGHERGTLRRKAASLGSSASRSLLGPSGVCRPSSDDAPLPAPAVVVEMGPYPMRDSTICRRSLSAASFTSRNSCNSLMGKDELSRGQVYIYAYIWHCCQKLATDPCKATTCACASTSMSPTGPGHWGTHGTLA